MNGFSVEVAGDGEGVLLAAQGEFDLAATEAVEPKLRDAEQGDATTIVFDLAGVSFIDSSGLRVLLAAAERAREAGRRFVVARPTGQVSKVLEMTDSGSLLEISETMPAPFKQS